MTAANGIANLNLNDPATPPSSPPSTPSATAPALTKAQILSNVLTLATQFSTCVEAFNLIHPSKETDHAQKVALAKIGLQQGRLLIFGDAVGISSPPATIARHMIPSHPGATNPDPHLPVNFGIRDPRLDEAETNDKVRAALNSIAGRPNHLSREEMMERYGLKSPKTFKTIEYPALDTNRLEAFREKYALLQDLVRQTGARANIRRGMSMMMTHWVVRDADKFNAFVQSVRIEVDGLIDLMGVKEQVDRGIRSDIRAMGWHPDLSGPVVHQDWEKLRLIREACVDDYPEYVDVADNALKYMVSELQGTRLASLSASYQPAITLRRKSEDNSLHASQKTQPKVTETLKTPEKEKRPGWLSHFKLKSWNKNGKGSPKHLAPSSNTHAQRSLSDTPAPMPTTDGNTLEPVRSKSLSAIPDEPAPLDLDSKIHSETAPVAAPIPEPTETPNGKQDLHPHDSFDEPSPLTQTETAKTEEDDHPALIVTSTTNSLVERHDMYRGVGRIVTSDIREKSHEAAAGK